MQPVGSSPVALNRYSNQHGEGMQRKVPTQSQSTPENTQQKNEIYPKFSIVHEDIELEESKPPFPPNMDYV